VPIYSITALCGDKFKAIPILPFVHPELFCIFQKDRDWLAFENKFYSPTPLNFGRLKRFDEMHKHGRYTMRLALANRADSTKDCK
jgi:hypothetical protein